MRSSRGMLAFVACALIFESISYAAVVEVNPNSLVAYPREELAYHKTKWTPSDLKAIIHDYAMGQARMECLNHTCERDKKCSQALEIQYELRRVQRDAQMMVPDPKSTGYILKERPFEDGEEYYFTSIRCTANGEDLRKVVAKMDEVFDETQMRTPERVCDLETPAYASATGSSPVQAAAHSAASSWWNTGTSLVRSFWGSSNTAHAPVGSETVGSSTSSRSTVQRLKDAAAAGLCAVGEAGKAYCEDLKHANLADPQFYDWRTHLARMGKMAALHVAGTAINQVEKSIWETEEDKQITLDALIEQARSRLKKNRVHYTDDQFQAYERILGEATALLAAYTHQKKEEFQRESQRLGGGYSVHSLSLAATAGRPTLLDLGKNHELKTVFQKLERILAIPTVPKRLDSEQVSEDCEKALKKHEDEFRTKLTTAATRIANASNNVDSKRKFSFYFGEPGNGKTTGILDLAKCTGLPVCLIDEHVVAKRPKTETSSSMMGVVATRMSLSEYIESEIVRCMTQSFNGYSNGIVLLDDIDRLLKAEFGMVEQTASIQPGVPMMKNPLEEEMKAERLRLFGLVKKYSDPAQKTIIDPQTGVPVNISKIDFFATSNSIPYEIKYGDAPFLSRIEKFAVPYLSPERRKALAQEMFDYFRALFEGKYSVKLDKTACQSKIDEILAFDLDRFNAMDKRLGVRGLEKLLSEYFNAVLSRASIASRSNALNSRICADDGANTFDVKKIGLEQADYKKFVSDELKIEDFENEVQVFYASVAADVAKVPDPAISQSIIAKMATFFSADPLYVKRENFKIFKRMVGFEVDRINVSTPEVAQAIGRKVVEDFQFLRGESDEPDGDRFKEVTKLANMIARKMRDERNRIVLVEKEGASADMQLIKSLADSFGVPACEITAENQMFEEFRPRWLQYQTDPVLTFPGSPGFPPQGFAYDQDRRIYIMQSSQHVSVWDAKNRTEVRLNPGEIDEKPGKKFLWLKTCLEKWKGRRFLGQGFVIINLPEGFDHSRAKEILKDLDEMMSQPYKLRGALYNLKEMTVFLVPHEASIAKGLNRENPDTTISFSLGAMNTEGRRKMAESFLAEGLKALQGKSKKSVPAIELTEQEQRLFNSIMDWDKKAAEHTKDGLPLEPLKKAVELLLSDIQERAKDVLGFGMEERSVEDLKAHLRRLYEKAHPEFTAKVPTVTTISDE